MDPENQNDEELALALQRALGAGACSTPPPAPSDARLAVARLAGKGIGSGTKRPPAAAAQQGPGSDGAPPARTRRLVSPARPPRGYSDQAVRQVTKLLRHGVVGRDRLSELGIGGWMKLSDVERMIGLPREVILDIVEHDLKDGKPRFEKTHGQGVIFVRATSKRSCPTASTWRG